MVKAGGEGGGALCKDESMAEVDLGRDRKRASDGRETHFGETL